MASSDKVTSFEALLKSIKWNESDEGECCISFKVPVVYAEKVEGLGKRVGWYFPVALGEPVDPKAK